MAKTIILPKLGQTMEEGTIVEWLKKEGDAVTAATCSSRSNRTRRCWRSNRATRAPCSRFWWAPGVKVPVLTPVGIIGAAGRGYLGAAGASAGRRPRLPPRRRQRPRQPRLRQQARAGAGGSRPRRPARGRVFGSPRARKLAARRGRRPGLLVGAGPDGRIVEEDVLAYLAHSPRPRRWPRKWRASWACACRQRGSRWRARDGGNRCAPGASCRRRAAAAAAPVRRSLPLRQARCRAA